jgi:pimeloyl-ACP methyl ester carboxylesterase
LLKERGQRNVLIDLLGFGNSPRPWIRYTTEVHLQSLRCTIEKERAPVTLIGHSLGAVLALAYAARYPSQVRALVLIGMPNFGGLPGAAKWFDAKPGGWLYTNMWAMALACVLTRRVAGRLLPLLLKKVPRELAEDMVKHNMASWVTTLWEVLYQADVCFLADHVDPRIPVLLLHGSADRSAPIEGVRMLVEQRPAWRLVVLEGVDHHPWLKDSEFCLHIIKQWLDEHD